MSQTSSCGQLKNGAHHITYRVYYEDTDAAGIVYYANYLKFAERARTDCLRLLGVNQSALWSEQQIGFVVRRCVVDFLLPARLDDEIVMQTTLHEVRKVRMSMHQTVWRQKEELVRLHVDIACVNAKRKPVAFPPAVIKALSRLETASKP